MHATASGDDVVVCVDSAEMAAAVRAVTPADVAIVVVSRERAAATTDRADIVLVEDRIRLADGWLDGLVAARGDDGTVASVSALILPEGAAQHAAARLRTAGSRLRPRTPAPRDGCVLVSRAALDLAGPLDRGFAARCSERGLLHLVAGEVVAAGPADAGSSTEDAEAPEPVIRAERRAGELASTLSVTIDARILRDPIAGTQVHTLELLAALSRFDGIHVRALVPSDPTPTAAAVLASLPSIEPLDASTVDTSTPATILVHRPYQVTSAIDLLTLRQVGERLVVTNQDLLSYHNLDYHVDRAAWDDYRRLTRAALEAASVVVAFSEHAAGDLRAEELVTSERLQVVPIGVDHRLAQLAAEPRPPARAGRLADAPYLLCLGTDLRHKNRPFAIRLLQALRERHGWGGRLVFAGVHMPTGSSADEEARLLAADAELAAAVIDVGAPDEREKAWLYAHAAAALYPTVNEGFGLVPFEAAAHGTPCLFAPQASLRETVGAHARLVPWDAELSAAGTVDVLSPGPAREALVADIAGAGARLTWDAAALRLAEVYETALAAPPSGTGSSSWAALETEAARAHWEGAYWEMFNAIGPAGMSLMGPQGTLPDSARRTLAALARRPATRRPLVAGLTVLGRLSRRGAR